MVVFNLDKDLYLKMVKTIDPSGILFCSLPLFAQEQLLAPFLNAQRERDRVKLSIYTQQAA